ncbi:MAG TPA: tetratricopeptide repeat protein [Candidatus Methylomirabilis sp.]|nr:tetratricopeptide repeat protein [Candidatus Methylomirabilis sp.]
MKCDQVRQAFSDLYDETLSGAPLVTITQHLATCQECRAEWTAFRNAMLAVSDLGAAEPSLGFAARVRQRIETIPRWQRVLHWLFFPLRVKVPIQALALFLVAFAGLLLYQRSPEMLRQAEVRPATQPPVTREVPATTPAPVAPQGKKEPAELKLDAKLQEAPSAPLPRARSEGERDRALSGLRDVAKPAERPATPAEPPRGEESSREFRAKTAEPGITTGRLQQAAPPPAESGAGTAPTPLAPKAVPPPPAGPRAKEAPRKEAQTSATQTRSADELYFDALADFSRQRYDRSTEDLRAFISQYPGDTRVPDARLRLADAYVAQRRLAEAVQEYERLIREYPESPILPAAMLRAGQARLDLSDRSGCEVLRDLTTRYPQAPEATPARETLSARCP